MNEEITTMAVEVIEFDAAVAIKKNDFPSFAIAARNWLKGINYDLKEDDQFEEAALCVKQAKAAEELIALTKEKALESMQELNAAFKSMDELDEELRTARLTLSKKIDTEIEAMKKRLIDGALTQLTCDPLRRESFRAAFVESIKGKRTAETRREAVRVKIAMCNDLTARNRKALDDFETEHGTSMTLDRIDLEVKPVEFVDGELRRRRDVAAAKKETERAASEAAKAREEAAKAKAALAESTKPPAGPVNDGAGTGELPLSGGGGQRVTSTGRVFTSPAPKVDDAPWLPDPDKPGPGSSITTPPSDPEPEPVSEAEAAELQNFIKTVVGAFVNVKIARKALVHEANKAKALELATLANAWHSKYSK